MHLRVPVIGSPCQALRPLRESMPASSESLGIGPEGADRRVGNLVRLQLTDRRAVDPRPFGHIREAQPLSLAFTAQTRQGLEQFRISGRRVFLSIGFDVAGQFVLTLGSLAVD